MPRITAWGVLVAVLCFAMVTRASPRRVAVIQPDDELLRAISLSLSPWGLQTMKSDAPLPSAAQPDAVHGASALARQLDVDALVWVTSLEYGSLLWVFDLGTGDVTTRVLPETPPFDGAAAAAVALSVKTVLRASLIAPPDERFGPASPPPPAPTRTFALQGGLGGLWLGGRNTDPRGELAGLWWFAAEQRLGLSVELSAGPGVRIEEPDYTGRYREFVGGAKLRFRYVDVPGVSTSVGVGAAAHWALLDGTLATESRSADSERLNVSVGADTSFDFWVSERVYLGASMGAVYFPAYQRYLVRGDPVFAPWPVAVNVAGHCGVELF